MAKKRVRKTSRKAAPRTPRRTPARDRARRSGRGPTSAAGRGKPLVGILYGSTSDEPVVAECVALLEQLAIPHETRLLSAHRMPKATAVYAQGAKRRGLRVLISMAGMAAHLPGVLASMTTLPVIGVPLCGSALEGQDALFSMVQMPAGVPVATVAVGKAGAKNAAILASQILALGDAVLARRLDDLKRRLESGQKV
ncbi:MAG: 5-(carboxyamino)imidazole ribonucleotide mutase [Candidatus Eisenbacteria bacterium]|nr:5-(carboxyamino)imidazole ribonucleotide mutase [Candidatus Eisenbacteria bacterium]